MPEYQVMLSEESDLLSRCEIDPVSKIRCSSRCQISGGEKLPSVPMHNIVQTPPLTAYFLHSLIPPFFVFSTLVAYRDDRERDYRMILREIKDSCHLFII